MKALFYAGLLRPMAEYTRKLILSIQGPNCAVLAKKKPSPFSL